MKSLISFIISIVIYMTLTSSMLKSSAKSEIVLQSTVTNTSSVSLKQSADIISERLKLYGLISFEVKVLPDKGQIKIQFPEKADKSEIEELVTSKGEIAFYETYTHNEIAEALKPGNELLKLLGSGQIKSGSDPRVGCLVNESREKTDQYLRSSAPVKDCKFVWGTESKKSGLCLFALKTSDGKPLIDRSDIDSIRIVSGKDPLDNKIQIKLKSEASAVFADATKRNLDRSIAIVIDNQVYSWPVVRNVIEGGKIEVTGDFTLRDVNCFPALFNSDQLPVDFKVIR